MNDPKTYDDAMMTVANELLDLLAAKHHDYGTKNLEGFGELGIIVRCSDKLARLESLLNAPSAVKESLEDTWFDLAGYAIQAILMGRDWLRKPLSVPQEPEKEELEETSFDEDDFALMLKSLGYNVKVIAN